MFTHSIFALFVFANLLGQKSLWAVSNSPAALLVREQDLRHFCAMEKNPAEPCPPGPDLSWRQRERLDVISRYLQTAMKALESGELPAGSAEVLEFRIQQIAPYEEMYRRALQTALARASQQEVLLPRLNSEINCKIIRYSEDEQQIYGREISLPECDPLEPADYERAARFLSALADVCLPQDAQPLRAKAQAYLDLGPQVREVSRLRREMEDLKVITRERDGAWRLNYIGHPFQKTDRTDLLAKYAAAIRALDRRWIPAFEPCPAPACDPVLLKIAEAVALRPGAAERVSDNAEDEVQPYAIRVFNQRYAGDPDVQRALGIDSGLEYNRDHELYAAARSADGKHILFTRVFARQGIVLTLGGWLPSASPLPLLYLLQEARIVVEEIEHMKANGFRIADTIHEVRFENADGSGRLLQLNGTTESGRWLSLKVLRFPDDRPVESVRQQLRRQMTSYFRSVAKTAI